ncbi:MAG: glycosyltransferase family A protein [Acidimicrobiales bacterium]
MTVVSAPAEEVLSDPARPRLTVVMTVYNGLPYLQDAVESVLDQTYRGFRLIVVDDGSTDGSGQYLDGITDPRLVVVHQANQGQHKAANRGIALAEGDLIARMDADDVAQPDRLAKQVAFLDANPQVGLVGGQILRMGARGAGMPSNLPTNHAGIVDDLLANRHGMCNATTMFRRKLFEQVGGYWEHNLSEDWDLFLRMAEVSELANLSDLLLAVRFHSRSLNGQRIVEAQLYNEFAAHQATLRAGGAPEVTFSQFLAGHRSRRWPGSWIFLLDCHALNQYRYAVADRYDGRRMAGLLHLGLSVLMAPRRTVHRSARTLTSRLRRRL